MPRLTSIRSQLSLIFFCIFGLVIVLGLFSISLIHNFNRLSAVVADEWLPTTRAIGDLNNYTSDFRAVEGSYLLASTPEELNAIVAEMARLDSLIQDAKSRFEGIRHEPIEAQLYQRFRGQWSIYQDVIARQRALEQNNKKAEAIHQYMDGSRTAYDAASHTLDELTDQAVRSAEAAKDRLTGGYIAALSLIWLTMFVAAALVGAALFYIRRLISVPLLQLTDCMHRLARNETNLEIPETGRANEIGEMARAAVVFRRNAIDLMRSRAILAGQASSLEERLAQERRLAAHQRNFISMASHEFRTPLTIIDGHARRLGKTKEVINAEEIGDRASRIRAAASRMNYTIDNLLTSSRVMDGIPPDFATSVVDVGLLLSEVCQLHREMAPAAKIAEHYGDGDLSIVGDQTLLFYVFSNILANAIKYSAEGGAIEVEVEHTPGGVTVSIADQGIGIPDSDRARLFERYQRGSNVASIVGTGVGLSLAKMVLDSHGASIKVQSELGRGSRFTVELRSKLDGTVELPSIGADSRSSA